MEQSKPSLKERLDGLQDKLKALFDQYGSTAIGVYLVFWVGTMAVIVGGIMLGFMQYEKAGSGFLWALGGGWALSRVTWPFRVGATLLITPWVHKGIERIKR